MVRLFKTSLICLTLLTTTHSALAEDWPRWLGPKGNGISTETGLAEKWPEDGPKKLWSQKTGIGYSSPVALDGKVYLFFQEDAKDTLRSFDADTGKVLWTQSYERTKEVSYPGSRATPSIEAGRIYTHGSVGDLVCREIADGKLVWRTNILTETSATPLEWGSTSSPTIYGDHIIVQGGKDGDAIAVAVDKKTGKVAWKSEKGLAGYATIIAIDVGSQKQLIAFAGEIVLAMDPATGKTLWSEPWKTEYDVNAATPIFRDSKLMVSSTRNFGVMMLDVTATGAKKEWEKKDISTKFQPAILDGEALYANNNGTLKAVKWPDFTQLWNATGRDFNLGAGGSLIRVGDKLITLSERGKLSLILATPKEYKLISSTQLFDYSQVWSTPLIYRGKLYAKGEDELVCLDISAPK